MEKYTINLIVHKDNWFWNNIGFYFKTISRRSIECDYDEMELLYKLRKTIDEMKTKENSK